MPCEIKTSDWWLILCEIKTSDWWLMPCEIKTSDWWLILCEIKTSDSENQSSITSLDLTGHQSSITSLDFTGHQSSITSLNLTEYMLTFSSVMKIMENCRTKTSFIYTVENIETSYIVFFSAIITFTICLLDLLMDNNVSDNHVIHITGHIKSNTGKSARQGNLRHPRVTFQSFAE
jgi:hypothetical protein